MEVPHAPSPHTPLLVIKYSEVHHIADDTNLLNFNSCVKSIDPNKASIFEGSFF